MASNLTESSVDCVSDINHVVDQVFAFERVAASELQVATVT